MTLGTRALATGRVRAVFHAPDEAAALVALAEIEAVLGPAPWAFVLEVPPSPGAPGELGFRVRVDLPDPAAAAALAEGVPGVTFEPWESPGLVEALDRGWLEEETEELLGVRVRRLMVGDEARQPDLHRATAASDPVLQALEGALGAAVAPFPLIAEERSAGLVPVVHRPTGRLGVEAWIGGDPLPERRRVLGAVAAMVASSPMLVPEVEFDEVLGALVVRCWLAIPPAAGLPADPDLDDPEGQSGSFWWGDRVGHCPEIELQVLTAPDVAPDVVVSGLSGLAASAELAGGPPRWVVAGGRHRFAPSWVGELPTAEVLGAWRGAAGVERIRVVPGMPYGLESSWPVLEPSWRRVGEVLWMRCHDPVSDRDRLEEVESRDPDERDHRVAAPIRADVRPILDTTGRRGLELRGGSEAFTLAGLQSALLDAGIVDPALSRIGTFGFDRTGVVVRRWWRDGVDPGPRRWVVAR